MDDNRNVIVTDGFSNPASERLYRASWPDEPATRELYEDGQQCGGCSFFAALNTDWGVCAHPKSRHHLETVFEHFTCPVIVQEGWGPHSFCEASEFHCRCGGHS
jgi:hypothetical protein